MLINVINNLKILKIIHLNYRLINYNSVIYKSKATLTILQKQIMCYFFEVANFGFKKTCYTFAVWNLFRNNFLS